MDALDGNAIAGRLCEIFGTEMTIANGACVHCGNEGPVAQAVVYNRAPGIVVRCPNCIDVLMVLVEVRGITCLDLSGLATLDSRSAPREG
jgi:hypothetical protein